MHFGLHDPVLHVEAFLAAGHHALPAEPGEMLGANGLPEIAELTDLPYGELALLERLQDHEPLPVAEELDDFGRAGDHPAVHSAEQTLRRGHQAGLSPARSEEHTSELQSRFGIS